jgi:hypothetical protein
MLWSKHHDKGLSDAISLKFLERKAVCIVASTKIAYGPSEPPSTDANLLGKLFFKNVINKESFRIALMIKFIIKIGDIIKDNRRKSIFKDVESIANEKVLEISAGIKEKKKMEKEN